MTIDGVARRAGITRPVIYGHFRDLQGLLEAMLERESARALGQLGRAGLVDVEHDVALQRSGGASGEHQRTDGGDDRQPRYRADLSRVKGASPNP